MLGLLGEQLSHAEIGARLFISVRTVESHVAALRRKLGATSRDELIRLAAGYRAVAAERASSASPPPPSPLTSFIGRDGERAALAAALGRARLVSAVGPGGVGKTRLALAVAADVADRFPSGAWYADLVPVTDPAMLPAMVAQAIGLAESSARPAEEVLIGGVGGRQALLILDNCEHLVNGVALLAERLLASCANLVVLVTSRIRLVVPHEVVYVVPGLSVPSDAADRGDAVALFAARAAAAGVPVESGADRRRVADICRALNGMPLAIELAAARLPSLGLDGLEAGLTDQLSLLVGGARQQRRHQSLTDTLDWSYRLLGAREQEVLRCVSVFAAPFGSSAAATVTGSGPGQVAGALARLAEHSLLVPVTSAAGTRYRALEPVRQFAATRLEAADGEQARARHLGWCLAVAAGLDGGEPAEPGWCENFDAAAGDLRAALGWSAARPGTRADAHRLAAVLARLLLARGRVRDSQHYYEHAAALADEAYGGQDGGLASVGDALECAAAIAKIRTTGEDALRLDRAAAAAFVRAGDPVAASVAFARCAEHISRFTGMYARLPAEGTVESLLADARAHAGGNPRARAAISLAEASNGGTASGAAVARALALARQAADPLLISAALDTAAAAQVMDGEIDRAASTAAKRAEPLVSLARDPRAAFELKDALHTAIFTELAAGQIARAHQHAEQHYRLPFVREERDLGCEDLLAPAALAGQWDRLLTLADQFRHGWEQAGSPAAPGRGMAPAAVAMVHGLRGDEGARDGWLRILAAIRAVDAVRAGHGSGYGEAFEAVVLLHRGRPGAALDVLSTGPESTGSWPFQLWRQWIEALRAEAAVLAGHPAARQHIRLAAGAAGRNPVATALAQRATALLDGDRAALLAAATAFADAGYPYQRARTLVFAGGAGGENQLAAMNASPMAPLPA